MSLAESPVNAGELWAGSDDGLVHVSRNGGSTWTNISSSSWPAWLRINTIDLSRHDPATAYVAANRYLVDDQRPYFYKTTDYGQTWQEISSGIGEHDFARVIREDPVRPGLLFAGTERGVYVSFDDGTSWQSLQLNLPAVAVHDLLVKDNDVVIGTHSRGFWILDDVTPLREITTDVTRANVHVFNVAPTYRLLGRSTAGTRGGEPMTVYGYGSASGDGVAYREVKDANGEVRRVYLNAGDNPPDGVVVTYYLREAPDAVTLTFKDPTGQMIQRLSADDGVPARAGTNRFVWNMRYPTARQLSPGAALSTMEWPRATAPVAPPGRYVVQIEARGETREAPFEIRKDPRLAWTDADLNAQFTLWVQTRDKLSETTAVVNRLREVKQQVASRAGQIGTREVVGRVTAKLTAIESALTRVVGSNPMHLPPKGLHQKFATLTNIIGSADGAPTRWTYAVFEQLSADLARQVEQLDALVESEVKPLMGSETKE
jgi:hypothetical protein